ncbi:MAG: SDR family NAD(P)-dependent oxidoreductase [Acidilobus sp.]
MEERYVLVTGGDRGIGKATALRFARAGFNVIITYKSNREAAEQAINDILSAGATSALYYQLDVSDPQAVEKLSSAVSLVIPYLNVLVNNAGILDLTGFEDLTPQRWDEVMRVDLYGPFYMIKYFLPLLKRAPWASIVNVASIAGETGNVVASVAYSAAKAGLIGLTKRLAVELAKYGIRVNAVAPSFVETDMTANILSDPATRDQVIAMHPLRRIASPADVAEAIYFLAVPETANNITGHVINVNGGRYT